MSWNWVKDITRSSIYLAIIAVAVMLIAAAIAPNPVGRWAVNFWLLLDQAVNSFVLLGDPAETISGRLGKWLLEGGGWWHDFIARPLCWFLDLFESDHCIKSVVPGVGGRSVI